MKNRKNFLKKAGLFVTAIIMAVSLNGESVLASSEEKNAVVMSSTSEEDPYEDVKKINLSDMFNQQQKEYYVYFYMNRCSYCNQIKEDMLNFAETRGNVYFVDYALLENRPSQKYNWAEVQAKYNKKIGYMDSDGNKIFLPGESERKYQNMRNAYGKKMSFNLITITSENVSSFPGAEIGDIYTDVQTPEIDYFSMRTYEDMMIAGVPSLFRIRNGRITEFYFDSPEISSFLNREEEKNIKEKRQEHMKFWADRKKTKRGDFYYECIRNN